MLILISWFLPLQFFSKLLCLNEFLNFVWKFSRKRIPPRRQATFNIPPLDCCDLINCNDSNRLISCSFEVSHGRSVFTFVHRFNRQISVVTEFIPLNEFREKFSFLVRKDRRIFSNDYKSAKLISLEAAIELLAKHCLEF